MCPGREVGIETIAVDDSHLKYIDIYQFLSLFEEI